LIRLVRNTYSTAAATQSKNQNLDFAGHGFSLFQEGAGLAKWFKFILALNIFLLSGLVHSQANSALVFESHSTVYILQDSFNPHFLIFTDYDQSVIRKSGAAEEGLFGHSEILVELEEESEEDHASSFDEHHFIDNALITRALIQPRVQHCRASFLRKKADHAEPVACYLLIQEFRI